MLQQSVFNEPGSQDCEVVGALSVNRKEVGMVLFWLLLFDEPGELGNYPASFHLGDKGLKQYFEMVKSFQV